MNTKKLFLYLPLLLALMVGSVGCSSDDNASSGSKEKGLLSFAHTGCKTAGTRADGDLSSATGLYGQEVVRYEATEDGSVMFFHDNAVFCCEADIKASASVEGNTIHIKEDATLVTNCICNYDLTMKVGTLEQGTYTVVIEDGRMEDITFQIEYSPTLKGEYIVLRETDDEDWSGVETIDFYGRQVPYTPMDEKDFPEWLQELLRQKTMIPTYRICIGNLSGYLVYHLDLWSDSMIGGRFYDENGNKINYECDFSEFIAQLRNIRCIYKKLSQ